MSLIPGTITVDFISNYAGPHRVCWRIGPIGPYNCTTIVSCAGAGAACQAVIAITVDNDTCDNVDFEGYVQATCQVDGSLVDRVPFSNTFIPNPACKGYTVTCVTVSVADVTIDNAGTGYIPGAPPVMTIAGGGGTGATATVLVGDDGILTSSITSGGAGYTDGSYFGIEAQTLTGTGSGAFFDVIVAGGVITSAVLSAGNLHGTGYAVNDTFEFDTVDIGAGAGGVLEVDSLDTGMIVFVTITAPGSGFTSVPTATVPAPGAGVTALFTAVLDECPNQDIGNECTGAARPMIRFNVGESTIICNSVVPPAAETGYTIVQDACCYNCRSYEITKSPTGGPAKMYYTDCDTRLQVILNIDDNYTDTICMVEDSLLIQEEVGSTTTVTPGLTCP